jgi:DNA repair ATPase RecN
MPINMSKDDSIPTDAEACYETVASQEEIYLEATEEEMRASFVSSEQSPSRATVEYWQSKIEELELDWGERASMTNVNNDIRTAESLDQQLEHAAEELITGDSDDPPLSEEAVVEMIRDTHIPKRPAR